MKIGAKLAAGFGALVLLMIILGATGVIQLKSVITGYGVDVKTEELAKSLAQQIKTDILQVRRNEKDFMARQDMKYFELGNKNLDLAVKHAKELQGLTSNQEIRTGINDALEGIAAYRASFTKLAKASEKRGVTPKLGLQGKFRGNAHELSAFMNAFDTENIRYWMLMLRRYEKDLNINRSDIAKSEKYQGKFKDALQSCLTAVKESHLEDDLKKQLTEEFTQYGTVLSDWFTGKADYNQVRALAGKSEKLVNAHYVLEGKVLLLTLRKEEKDYMLRRDLKYMERLDKVAAELQKNIEASKIDASMKKELLSLVDNYTKGIDDLVDIDNVIGELLKEMKQNADPVMKLSDNIVEIMANSAEQLSNDISSAAKTAITIVWAIGILSVIIAVIFAYFFARSISVPVGKTMQMLNEMGLGHLDMRLKMDSKDEIGEMARTMDRFADDLQSVVVAALEQLAVGDLTFDASPKDNRDVIGTALKKTGDDLNRIVGEILAATEQIAAGSGQVSDSSQSLSQGATESAASLEQITSSMTEMASQTSTNAENSSQANQLASKAKGAAETGNEQMQKMVMAMGEINDAGQNISKIIKVIDEIAFQTNLLALNAAVEAARAGRHGKGFAVVAEEVRNLAARSAKAAKETAELIEGSVEKASNGTKIANQTAHSLSEIVTSVTKVTELVGEIAAASNEQAEGISQVNQGLTQIDQVTQQNTASAEEGAAAAEELSSQAAHLKGLMSTFTVRGGTATASSTAHPGLPRPAQVAGPVEGVWGGTTEKKGPNPSEVIALDDKEFGKY